MPLREFVRAAWPVVEPGRTYHHGWHIDAICDHLEAVTRGEIKNLVINIPPRHMKSLLVSVFWPTWRWTFEPELRWIFASYAQHFTTRDALKSRRVIQSPWYRQHFGNVYQLTGDQNAKTRYENSRTGFRFATSVQGGATGEGGDVIVADDPHNAREASSTIKREGVLEWWDETMSTRLNDPDTGARIIIMQRLHERDLTGHVLAQGGYEHLCLPAEYEPTTRVTGIGFMDPRTDEGDLLWPARFNHANLTDLKLRLGPYGTAGQLQQRPVARGGGMFRREWWRWYSAADPLPPFARMALAVDSASKEHVGSDYTAAALWAVTADGQYYLLDRWRDRLELPALLVALHNLYARHRHRAVGLPLLIEDKNSGTQLLQTLRRPHTTEHGRRYPALPVTPFPLEGKSRRARLERELAALSKEVRADSITPIVAAGLCHLPADAPWIEDWLTEHEQFPAGVNDDQVDTTTMGLVRLSHPAPPPDEEATDAATYVDYI